MKNFNEFTDHLDNGILEKIFDDTWDSLDREIKELGINNPEDEFLHKRDSYPIKITMRILREYHEWVSKE